MTSTVRSPEGLRILPYMMSTTVISQGIDSASLCSLSPNFLTFKEPKNRLQGTAWRVRYENYIPTRLAPIDCLKISALGGRYDNTILTRFLAPIDCFKIPAPPACLFVEPLSRVCGS